MLALQRLAQQKAGEVRPRTLRVHVPCQLRNTTFITGLAVTDALCMVFAGQYCVRACLRSLLVVLI